MRNGQFGTVQFATDKFVTAFVGGHVKKWITLAFLCLAFFFYMSDRLLPFARQADGETPVSW